MPKVTQRFAFDILAIAARSRCGKLAVFKHQQKGFSPHCHLGVLRVSLWAK